MRSSHFVAIAIWGLLIAGASADEHRVETLDEGPPADELAESIREQLADKGMKVIRGSSRTVGELWICREWEAAADFKATEERLYPFQPGQLIGVLRLRRRGNDFRDQQIPRGVYTLRYALQPIDGNHEGTSPTRDFLVLVKAKEDDVDKKWTVESLMTASADAAGSNHPAMLCLQAAKGERKAPSIRHVESKDWWILQLSGQAAANGKKRPLPVDLVVAGHADE